MRQGVHRQQIDASLPGLQLRGESQIRFGPDSPARGLGVIQCLACLYEVVTSMVVGFGPKFP
jgi:hypothetical protein